MTPVMRGARSADICVDGVRLSEIVDEKYGSGTAAAQAWGISPSQVSRLCSGERGKRPRLDVLKRIAEVEGIPLDELRMPRGANLVRRRTESESQVRFAYDLDKPHEMLLQVQNWFADVLPDTPRVRRQVVKAVMRTLVDETFGGPHRPSRQWQITMDQVEGWPRVTNRRFGNR